MAASGTACAGGGQDLPSSRSGSTRRQSSRQHTTLCNHVAMSDLGLIVTGAVGAAGIGGTLLGSWLTGRQQMAGLRLTIADSKEREHSAEKRKIYAECMSRFQEALEPVLRDRVGRRRIREDGEGPWLANLDAVAQAKTALDVAVNQVALIAPQEVVRLAASAGDAFNRYVRDTANGTNLDAPLGFASTRDALLIAMRADLGEPPGGAGWL
jgi:hypothetical protein